MKELFLVYFNAKLYLITSAKNYAQMLFKADKMLKMKTVPMLLVGLFH